MQKSAGDSWHGERDILRRLLNVQSVVADSVVEELVDRSEPETKAYDSYPGTLKFRYRQCNDSLQNRKAAGEDDYCSQSYYESGGKLIH